MAEFPKSTTKPDPQDIVQVLMTEKMARLFEERVLNVDEGFKLAGPLIFSDDDLPTYIIEVPN